MRMCVNIKFRLYSSIACKRDLLGSSCKTPNIIYSKGEPPLNPKAIQSLILLPSCWLSTHVLSSCPSQQHNAWIQQIRSGKQKRCSVYFGASDPSWALLAICNFQHISSFTMWSWSASKSIQLSLEWMTPRWQVHSISVQTASTPAQYKKAIFSAPRFLAQTW